jgi:predicted lipoprotein with Yx(FWY)xxD motif
MRHLSVLAGTLTIAALALGAGHSAQAQSRKAALVEDYIRAPLPPGFQVVNNELEGPVFADQSGKTLYVWPLLALRNGDAGEQKGKPTCDDKKYTENAGLMSPYPGGFILPEVDKRPSCIGMWPPVPAPEDAKATGKWSVVKRPDGARQWAYDGFALYTSVLDHKPGDVLGGTKRGGGRRDGGNNAAGARREAVGPAPAVPPGFIVNRTVQGRMITDAARKSVYTWDKDGANKSNCIDACTEEWKPVTAPVSAQSQGEWSVFERTPGVKQWAFRKRPLYTHVLDPEGHNASLEGSDVPGWHNVYTQMSPTAPKGVFTVQDAPSGQVLADARGHTVYVYNCNDDAWDQLACDHPDTPQDYRMAICGGGDPGRCLTTFPFVMAAKDAKSDNQLWGTMEIDPKTGHRAASGQSTALHVWTYRDRPVFTFAGDKNTGDLYGDSWGEFQGQRNGFKAFWVRDDYFGNAS